MDAHFSEYLAAVAGMQEIYGTVAEGHPTDFHDACPPHPAADAPVAAAA